MWSHDLLDSYVTSGPHSIGSNSNPVVPLLSALFVLKGHGQSKERLRKVGGALEKEGQNGILSLKLLNVELIVCTGFEVGKKKKAKSLNVW